MRRIGPFMLVVLTVAMLAGCDRLGPRGLRPGQTPVFTPGWEVAAQPLPRIGAIGRERQPAAPVSVDPTFGWEPADTDDRGWVQFQVTIGRGGSPAAVAEARFT